MTSSFIATTWLAAALVVTSSGAAGLDLTMEEGASGPLVVTAVVNRIRDRCDGAGLLSPLCLMTV